MPYIDRTQPYDVVYGSEGVRLYQGGKMFYPSGLEVGCVATDDDVANLNVDLQTIPDVGEAVPAYDFENMHWRQLKALVESFGGEYVDKWQAIEFLTAQQQETAQ